MGPFGTRKCLFKLLIPKGKRFKADRGSHPPQTSAASFKLLIENASVHGLGCNPPHPHLGISNKAIDYTSRWIGFRLRQARCPTLRARRQPCGANEICHGSPAASAGNPTFAWTVIRPNASRALEIKNLPGKKNENLRNQMARIVTQCCYMI